ncbi:4-amino-4-deoxy-L-arabinose-phospho-UDP flippase [Pseudomonas sp. S75]|uniref:4-amino-4-deoxy-L-arabinose-phospho-UDP flippase n=1 Tax=unclassified Pseudomonas TaxID=196821 RepID=UPI0019081CA7|nr:MULTISPECIES: 4-amino-4-deoxy-L-arabinose-phospho-UDP flippase [unclassified Pseudomonas]MBJ9975034.1 4-amino-4-deoxy-L-arabinose-phospho-UDP flippase [Pseudomonas sp. S30]MBK0152871.1 4-amino-4-deoxy-L-arabinose-phospho-UDP flippase [Pseudomonas sp. S75]
MTLMLVLATSLLTCCAQVAQKLTARRWAALDPAVSSAALICTPWPWVALVSLGSALACWLLVLQRMDVGIAYPMLSVNFILVALTGRYLFGEVLDARSLAGIALIASGVSMLGWIR